MEKNRECIISGVYRKPPFETHQTWFICGWFDDGDWCCPLRLIEQLVSLESARPLQHSNATIRERKKALEHKKLRIENCPRVNHRCRHYYTTSFINIERKKNGWRHGLNSLSSVELDAAAAAVKIKESLNLDKNKRAPHRYLC